MDRAVRSYSALETYVLATPKTVRGREAEELGRHGQTLGLGVVVLDWTERAPGLPALAVLAAGHAGVAEAYLDGAALADVAGVRDHPAFPAAVERLRTKLSTEGVGFAGARMASRAQLASVFTDAAAARSIAGASPSFWSTAPPLVRAGLSAQLLAWWSSDAPTAVLLGREGSGKSWSALGALEALSARDGGPCPSCSPRSAPAIRGWAGSPDRGPHRSRPGAGRAAEGAGELLAASAGALGGSAW